MPLCANAIPRLFIPALVAVTMGACGDSRPPLAFWDMYLGMPYEAFDSISRHDQGVGFTCSEVAAGFRECRVDLRGTPGAMVGVVDTAGRMVAMRFISGAERAEGDNRTLANAAGAAQLIWADWTKVTPPDSTGSMAERTLVETWRAGEDDRYRGRLAWWSPRVPKYIELTDEAVMAPLRRQLFGFDPDP